jgi:hypothetical protein
MSANTAPDSFHRFRAQATRLGSQTLFEHRGRKLELLRTIENAAGRIEDHDTATVPKDLYAVSADDVLGHLDGVLPS